MQGSNKFKEFYSEAEAARLLGISLSELYDLLDQQIFTDGSRPELLTFRYSDLVLLRFWHRGPATIAPGEEKKVLRMPKRS